jgi:hypothetical protein
MLKQNKNTPWDWKEPLLLPLLPINWRNKKCSALVHIIPLSTHLKHDVWEPLCISRAYSYCSCCNSFALSDGRRAGGGRLCNKMFARTYCTGAAAIVDEDRPGHTGGSACLQGGDGDGFWAWAASSSDVNMSNMTWTSL